MLAVCATGCGSGSSSKASAVSSAAQSAGPLASDGLDSGPAMPLPSAPASAGTSLLTLGTPPMSKSVPVSITVPSIGVSSSLMNLGLNADGSLQVPPGAFPAGWYTGAPTPGELGPAIIVGHVDWSGHAGVFYRLRDLKPGAQINVTRADGSVAVFRVSSIQEFPKTAFPTTLVYGNTAYAGLRLVTCGGAFNSKLHSYDDDIVAFAELVPPSNT